MQLFHWGSQQAKTKNNNTNSNSNSNNTSSNNKENNTYMIVPDTKGFSESLKNIHSKHRMQVHFKEGNTIRNLLVTTNDEDKIAQKSGVIYRYKCDRVQYNEEFIG